MLLDMVYMTFQCIDPLIFRQLQRLEGDLHRQQLFGGRLAAEAGVQGGRDEPQRRPRPLCQGNQLND